MIGGYLCLALAAAVELSVSTPDGNLKKFEENMKKKWDSILEKHDDLPGTTGSPVISEPTSFPALDAVHDLAESEGATTVPTVAPIDFSKTLADLKKRLHEDVAKSTEPLHLDHLASPAPEDAEVPDLLNNLHKHIHDVHSSVHDVLHESLNHPGLKPAVQSLDLEHHDDAGDDDATNSLDSDLLAPQSMKVAGKDDAEAAESSKEKSDDSEDAPKANDDEAEGSADFKPAEGKDADAVDAARATPLVSDESEAMHGMKQLMGAVKMIVMLQPMLEPLKEKLSMALEHMAPEDQAKAEGILKHIKALDVYSKVTAGLMAGVIAAKDGSEEDKEKAMATLIVGVKQIQKKVAEHLIEMKTETQAMKEDGAPADVDGALPHEHAVSAGHAGMPMDKMTALLVKLGKQIAQEIKDPANRHNPKVLLDIKLFLAVKDSVEKTQALMMAGGIALKQAKTAKEKTAVKAAVKKGMGKVVATLKSKMATLKKEALMLAVAAAEKAKGAEEGKGGEEGEGAAAAGEEDARDGAADSADSEKGSDSEKSDESSGAEAEDASTEDEEDSRKKPKASDASEDADEDAAPKAKKSKKPAKAAEAKAADDDDDDDSDDTDDASAKASKKPAATKPKKHAASDDEDDDDAPKKPTASKPKHATDDAAEEASADKDGTDEDKAKQNHPEISSADIAQIFGEAENEATGDQALKESADVDSGHLRTH
jgi:hypothetical protein